MIPTKVSMYSLCEVLIIHSASYFTFLNFRRSSSLPDFFCLNLPGTPYTSGRVLHGVRVEMAKKQQQTKQIRIFEELQNLNLLLIWSVKECFVMMIDDNGNEYNDR